MNTSIPLPQLARVRRRLERERSLAVEIAGWVGSGVEVLAEALLAALPDRCRRLPDQLLAGTDTAVAAWLQADARSGVRWWIVDSRPDAAMLRAFERHRQDSHQLVWASASGGQNAAGLHERWSPRWLLLRTEEVLDLAGQESSSAIGIAEARALCDLTDGWLEPLRRALAADRLPRNVNEALAIEGMRGFFTERLLAGWPKHEIEALRRYAGMSSVPLAAMRDRRVSGGGEPTEANLFVDHELLVPAVGGGWRVPRLLAAALNSAESNASAIATEPSNGATMSSLRRDDPEAAVALAGLAAGEEDLRLLFDERWLEVLSSVPIDAVRGALRLRLFTPEAEPASGLGLLAGVAACLDRPTVDGEALESLTQLAWRGDKSMLAAVAELCSQLIRFARGGWHPLSTLDVAAVEREWTLALRGLYRLHGLTAGTGPRAARGTALEEVWLALGFDALNAVATAPTMFQEVGLRVIAELVAGDAELRRRLEALLASGREPLRRRLEPWLQGAGAVPVRYDIHLLGPPGVRRRHEGGSPETLEGSLHRELLLLARLATAGRRGATREEIRQVVWPDRSAEFVERNLHPTVSRLRRTLWLETAEMPDPIVARQGVYHLAPQYAWRVDVLEFSDAVAEAEEARRRGARGAEVRWLEQACDLCDGPFLPGFDEPWPASMRERLTAQRSEACHRLADLVATAGERGRAVDLLRLVLAESPADERAHRRLMELFRELGRRDLVLRQYERLVASLESQGTVPDQETATLFRELMR